METAMALRMHPLKRISCCPLGGRWMEGRLLSVPQRGELCGRSMGLPPDAGLPAQHASG